MDPLPDPYRSAMDRALDLLARRPYARAELRDRLVGEGASPELVDAVDERLAELGLLDDRTLARDLAEAAARRGRGRAAVTAELARRGVPADIAIQIMEATSDGDEGERALALARKRLPALGRLPPPVAARRLGAFLMRRGFDQDVAEKTCRRLLTAGVD